MKVAIGVLNVSLIKLLRNLRKTNTITRFVHAPALGVGKHISKGCRRSLERRRVGISDIVCRDIEIRSGGVEAAKACVKTHAAPPCALGFFTEEIRPYSSIRRTSERSTVRSSESSRRRSRVPEASSTPLIVLA